MSNSFSPANVMKVISSWETTRQRQGFDEQLGIDTLLALFKLDPSSKTVFGFPVDREVKAQGMQRMGVLIHGLRIVKMLDGIFSVIGPDEDMFAEILADMSEEYCQIGLSPEHFTLLCRAFLEVMKKIMGSEWTSDVQEAWSDVIHVVNIEIAKNIQANTETTSLSFSGAVPISSRS